MVLVKGKSLLKVLVLSADLLEPAAQAQAGLQATTVCCKGLRVFVPAAAVALLVVPPLALPAARRRGARLHLPGLLERLQEVLLLLRHVDLHEAVAHALVNGRHAVLLVRDAREHRALPVAEEAHRRASCGALGGHKKGGARFAAAAPRYLLAGDRSAGCGARLSVAAGGCGAHAPLATIDPESVIFDSRKDVK
eukprot:CAMPEP_0197491156 /NCGR_PEP_ID=MMETSP1311-20131121/5498_1 /TAXON_ID=464262 /ORGANISM="Genus nov. species nov., Strain RCC856" /LENGTH=193 /DNA_ID=CAMNT_0043035783 /DNA_START=12 /DNA_END=592 /DNA_ORIENTATION=-